MKILRNLLWLMVYALPAVLFFSYHPVIGLGANDSMNFELSLPLIWLILFDTLSFIAMIVLFIKKRKLRHPTTDSTQKSSVRKSKPHPASVAKSQPHLISTKKHQSSKSSIQGSWGPHLPGLTDRRFFLLSIFPLYLTISIFWSANPLRGLLTAGVMWAVFFAVFALLFILPQTSPPRRLRTHVLLIMFVSAVLVCKFCYAQSIMDILGLSRDTTLLCRGCTYRSFGFPHPSGFAIEPQFMGNLLLAPTLTALYLVAFRSRRFANTVIHEAAHLEDEAEHKILHDKVRLPEVNWKFWQRVGMILLAGFLSMTLFFTFSRGAIYAYAVAILVMFIFALKRHQFHWSLITIPAVSLLLSLGLQGTFSAVGPTAETFISGVTKSIHHLSLGLIDLRPTTSTPENCKNVVNSTTFPVENSDKNAENSSQSGENQAQNVQNPSQNCAKPVDKLDQDVDKIASVIDQELEKEETKLENEAETTLEDVVFEGYVPESTNIRLKLNQVALWTWLSAPYRAGTFTIGLDCIHPDHPECNQTAKFTPSSFLFGVGLGGAGTAMHASYPDKVTSPKEIVQHQGFSLLLETGLLGVILGIFGVLIVFVPQLFSRKFLDGKSATKGSRAQVANSSKSTTRESQAPVVNSTKSSPSPFWQHPALPLLLALIIAYLITLNFFSGLPNALQIYLMPPLLYLIFSDNYRITT